MHNVADLVERGAHRAFPFLATALAFVFAIPVLIALAVSPDALESGRVRLTPPCPLRSRTGSACPGCGLTRATAAFAHGEWRRAVAYHRGGPPVFVGALVGSGLLARLAIRRFRSDRAQN